MAWLPPNGNPVIAAGVLLMTREKPHQFLLMKHTDRWDLPKGHADPGETPRQTALRELCEETGIVTSQVQLDEQFEFQIEYTVCYPREETPRLKRVFYYLGWVPQAVEIHCTEHPESQWLTWNPPHKIQEQTIDPLLEAVFQFLGEETMGSCRT